MMNGREFMDSMERRLSALGKSPREITEILADFEEHIATGIAGGRTEEDVVAGIGDPAELAVQYGDGQEPFVKSPPSVTPGGVGRGVLAAVGLLFFDLLIALPILISLFAVLLSLWAAALSIAAVAAAVVLVAFVPLTAGISVSFFPVSAIPGVFLVCIGVSLLALAVLAGIGMYFLSKWFVLGVKGFLVAQARIVKGGARS